MTDIFSQLAGGTIGAAIGAVLSAVFLRFATTIILKFLPPFGMAYKAAFFCNISTLFLGFIANESQYRSGLGGYLVFVVIAFIVNAVILRAIFKHSKSGQIGFGKACLIILVQTISLLIVAGGLLLLGLKLPSQAGILFAKALVFCGIALCLVAAAKFYISSSNIGREGKFLKLPFNFLGFAKNDGVTTLIHSISGYKNDNHQVLNIDDNYIGWFRKITHQRSWIRLGIALSVFWLVVVSCITYVQYEKLSTGNKIFSFVHPDQERFSVSGSYWLFENYQREMTYEQAQRGVISFEEAIDLTQPNILVVKTRKLILLVIIPISILWLLGAITVWVVSGFKKENIPDITSPVFPAKVSCEPESIPANFPPVEPANEIGEKGP